jgi:hypothetical protein
MSDNAKQYEHEGGDGYKTKDQSQPYVHWQASGGLRFVATYACDGIYRAPANACGNQVEYAEYTNGKGEDAVIYIGGIKKAQVDAGYGRNGSEGLIDIINVAFDACHLVSRPWGFRRKRLGMHDLCIFA